MQLAVRTEDDLTIYMHAYVIKVICSPLSSQVIKFAQSNYPHLRNLQLADRNRKLEDLSINMLIGADFFWSFTLDSVVRGENGCGPIALLTRFGYIISGPVPVQNTNEFSSNIITSYVLKAEALFLDEKQELKEERHRFWDYETLGTSEKSTELSSNNLLENKIKFGEGKYEVMLPFKPDYPTILDNYQVAEKD